MHSDQNVVFISDPSVTISTSMRASSSVLAWACLAVAQAAHADESNYHGGCSQETCQSGAGPDGGYDSVTTFLSQQAPMLVPMAIGAIMTVLAISLVSKFQRRLDPTRWAPIYYDTMKPLTSLQSKRTTTTDGRAHGCALRGA